MPIRNNKQWRAVFGTNLLLAVVVSIIYFLIHRYRGFQSTLSIAIGFLIAVGVCQLANLLFIYRRSVSVEIFTLCLLLLFLFLFSIFSTGNLFLFIFPLLNYAVLKMTGTRTGKRR
jgi:hypothetical protein